ncbi:hypothetical protein SETIT_1G324200v2 [Setaria italica]|uniref:VQ domain-containing protein n=2 Tax=Setaria italica TaxID=4555 RepID=A0A368PRJ2_SETIT|nr:hypothetical protein SETIT_1G324200v2 [Setaria italica]
MYSCEQDHTAAARTAFADTGYHRACAAPRSLQPAAAHRPGQQVLLPAAAAAVAAVQPRRAKSKKRGAPSRPSSSSSRRSSTTVVATDVSNFRAMVQELTGFPPAAIFRPLPRRVHAASPFVGVSGGAGQGCSGSERRGHGGSEATNSGTRVVGGGGGTSPDAPAAALPVMAQPPPPQCAPLGVFDGLADLGSPEFDSWGDLTIE